MYKLVPLYIISSSQFIVLNRYKIMEFVGVLNSFQLYWVRVQKRVEENVSGPYDSYCFPFLMEVSSKRFEMV